MSLREIFQNIKNLDRDKKAVILITIATIFQFLSSSFYLRIQDAQWVIIQDLVVKEKFRNQNIEKYLMSFIERYAVTKNVKIIYFETL